MSLPARGAWIEMQCPALRRHIGGSRSPLGERGLKCRDRGKHERRTGSLPARGAWIEMIPILHPSSPRPSLPARGAWIEISPSMRNTPREASRSPLGERGLKFSFSMCVVLSAGRSPLGERGLKCQRDGHIRALCRRSPRGEHGLNFHFPLGCRFPLGGRGLNLNEGEYL